MTDLLLPLIVDYGLYIIGIVIFVSCLAVPTPSSPMMLVAGGFAAAGDLVLSAVYLTAFFAAIAGDNFTYLIARLGGEQISDWIHRRPGRSGLYRRAETFMSNYGGSAVFFSRWLIGPLGPYMNYVVGITRFSWPRFFVFSTSGAAIWVAIYTGLGYVFADQIETVGRLMGNISGFIVASVLVVVLGIWAWRASHPTKDTP